MDVERERSGARVAPSDPRHLRARRLPALISLRLLKPLEVILAAMDIGVEYAQRTVGASSRTHWTDSGTDVRISDRHGMSDGSNLTYGSRCTTRGYRLRLTRRAFDFDCIHHHPRSPLC